MALISQLSPPPDGVGLGVGVIFGLLIIVGLIGNTLVCVAIYANKKLRKKENLYFVSLACADLLLCTLIMPFAAYNDVAGDWPFGEYCKIWMSLDIMCCTSSILHLCAISFDRCYHIHFPMQYGQRMSCRKILSAITLVWVLSVTIAFAPLTFESHFDQALSRHVFQANWSLINRTPLKNTTFYKCSFSLEPEYAVVSSLISFYLPSCVMITAYAKLYKYARRHVKTIKDQLQTAATLLVNVANTAPVPGATDKSQARSSFVLIRKRDVGVSDSKARVTLGVIVGLFIFSWGPFFVCNIARSFCGTCVPQGPFMALTWMGYANSAQNPIIYSIFNRDFRRAFGKILLCEKKRNRIPSIIVDDRFLVVGRAKKQGNWNKFIRRRLSRLSCEF